MVHLGGKIYEQIKWYFLQIMSQCKAQLFYLTLHYLKLSKTGNDYDEFESVLNFLTFSIGKVFYNFIQKDMPK